MPCKCFVCTQTSHNGRDVPFSHPSSPPARGSSRHIQLAVFSSTNAHLCVFSFSLPPRAERKAPRARAGISKQRAGNKSGVSQFLLRQSSVQGGLESIQIMHTLSAREVINNNSSNNLQLLPSVIEFFKEELQVPFLAPAEAVTQAQRDWQGLIVALGNFRSWSAAGCQGQQHVCEFGIFHLFGSHPILQVPTQ